MISLTILVVLILILILLISVRNKTGTGTFGKIIILITCYVIGAYILINIAWLLYFFFGDFSEEELW